MNYSLGSYYPTKETKILEFKEYCFKICPSLEFSGEQILNYVKGNWDKKFENFNKQNIKIYFDYYVPKYLSCFANSNVNGKLIIGINDALEITGIPSMNITIDFLNKILKSTLKKYTKCEEDLSNLIKINLIEVDHDSTNITNEIGAMLDLYYKELKEYNKIYKEYKKKRKVWEKKIYRYSSKLVTYLNEKSLRKEFTNFLINENNSKLDHLIKLLKSDEYIAYPKLEEFLVRKQNDDDILYWLVIFKDLKVKITNETCKPKKPKFYCTIDPETILMKLSYLRYNLYEKIKYYVIEIDYNTENTEKPVYFKLPKRNKWIKRQRIGLVNNKIGPGCI